MANILLVDDDDDVIQSVTLVLQKEGYTVHSVPNADDAMKHLDSNSVDLIITDLIMPGMNGVDLIISIKQKGINAKIIAISGGGNFGPLAYQPNAITTTAYLEAATVAGADTVLTKPFQRKELVEVVKNTLNA